MKSSELYMSIIIPTYNDWDRLQLCLSALQAQTYSADKFEVIVVNNKKESDLPVGFLFPENFILINEPKPGSYSCRNSALKIAKGDIIGFTDSDCIPDKDWLKMAILYFEKGNADRVGGKVEIFPKDERNITWAELYESFFAFNQKRNVELLKASITANFFTRKKFFDQVGLFDAEKKSGEDFGWNRRANNYKLNLIYAEDVIVKHPARSSFSELAQKKRRVFGGQKKFNFKSFKGICKEIIYIPMLFVLAFLLPSIRLFKESQLRLIDKFKVVYVTFYLFGVLVTEYFRLLAGGNRVR